MQTYDQTMVRGAAFALPWDLVLIGLLAVMLNGLALLNGTGPLWVLRLLVALPLLLVFPGYALALALFPRRAQLSGPERLALSLVFSIALLVFISLSLYYLGVRLDESDLRLGVTGVLAALLVAGGLSRARLPRAEQFTTGSALPVAALRETPDRLFAGAAVLLLLVSGGALGYTTAVGGATEHFTEFSVQAPAASASGTALSYSVTITNQERHPQAYTVRVAGDNHPLQTVPVATLQPGATWTQLITVGGPTTPPLHDLQLTLSLDSDPAAYRELHLWLAPAAQK